MTLKSRRPKYPLLCAGGLLLFGLAVLRISFILFKNPPDYSLLLLAVFFLACSAMAGAFFAFRSDRLLYNTGNGWGLFKVAVVTSVICSGFLLVVQVVLGADSLQWNGFTPLFYFIISCAMVGMYEEWMYRAGIQNLLLQKPSFSPHKAVLTTSAVFGLSHLLNLIEKPFFITGTISQVLYSFALGYFCGTVYYFSRNIWLPIIAHALFNCLASVSGVFAPPTATAATATHSDLPLLGVVIQLIAVIPFLIAARRLWKKIKVE